MFTATVEWSHQDFPLAFAMLTPVPPPQMQGGRDRLLVLGSLWSHQDFPLTFAMLTPVPPPQMQGGRDRLLVLGSLWSHQDSNLGPHECESCALTNWAMRPRLTNYITQGWNQLLFEWVDCVVKRHLLFLWRSWFGKVELLLLWRLAILLCTSPDVFS